MKSPLKANSTASTAIRSRSRGIGTNNLVTNIMEPKNAAISKRVTFCTEFHAFRNKAVMSLKNLDYSHNRLLSILEKGIPRLQRGKTMSLIVRDHF